MGVTFEAALLDGTTHFTKKMLSTVQGDPSGCSLDFVESKQRLPFSICSLFATFVLLLTTPGEQHVATLHDSYVDYLLVPSGHGMQMFTQPSLWFSLLMKLQA